MAVAVVVAAVVVVDSVAFVVDTDAAVVVVIVVDVVVVVVFEITIHTTSNRSQIFGRPFRSIIVLLLGNECGVKPHA